MRSTQAYHWDLTPGRVNERGFSVRYPRLALSLAGAKEDLQSLVVSALANYVLICRFQIRKNQSSRTSDEVIEDPRGLGSSLGMKPISQTAISMSYSGTIPTDCSHECQNQRRWYQYRVFRSPLRHRVVEILGWAVHEVSNRESQTQMSGHSGSKRRGWFSSCDSDIVGCNE